MNGMALARISKASVACRMMNIQKLLSESSSQKAHRGQGIHHMRGITYTGRVSAPPMTIGVVLGKRNEVADGVVKSEATTWSCKGHGLTNCIIVT